MATLTWTAGAGGTVGSTILVVALLAFAGAAGAQSAEEHSEDSIKAAFLFKFGDYVDWPADTFADATSPLVIGVLGAAKVESDLSNMVAGRSINGRGVEVRKVGSGESLAGIHVLFVGRGENGNLGTILEDVAGRPVLVVTETDEVQAGGTINFVMVGNKVRFDVRLAFAEASNLKISARLLGVARNVINGSS